MTRKIVATAVMCVGLFVVLPGDASGQDSGASSWGWGPGAAGLWFSPNFYQQEHLPYFTVHPPVYYKDAPVARTYGYSPFAYPVGTRTPNVGPAAPVTIRNQFVPRNVTKEASRDLVTQTPRRIVNPYYRDPSRENPSPAAYLATDRQWP
ncbi:MAG: hypothetical protein HQ581_07805 [Planctomycetes bacterium]|nr:hypothetical protein [Planctomycetota bacterium]